ncbi:hypothetical protein O1Q96_00410 (plasmid) [Streptomyces sp. Qhu-G9]|uniref:hypothetical protein n=1 Tax=Streptomyces sp. Qhu-G9 TaxID=3452799 RepID=UPI0022ABF8B0|nr:hypothetical protein [Streptomyces aurantiacus]WAU78346.1 hypothetical protein O1Q96_00410 [Streptomyces aurantiacus]
MAGNAHQGDPRTTLEFLLREQPRTYDEVTQDFARLAGELGEDVTLSTRHLRRLASGERTNTTPVMRRVLQAMFGRPLEDLLAPWDGVLPAATAGSTGLVLATGQPTADKELIEMAARRAKSFALAAGQTDLTTDVLEQVHEDVQRLATDYPQRPLTELLPDLFTTQDTLFTLLEQQRRPTQARQLYFLAGVTGGLLAKASHDLADPYAALTQARTAFVCADNADHNGLRAWIRGIQSLVSYWAGRTRESVKYAQSGAAFAPNSTASVWLPVSEARAWAALGNANATRAAIERAETAWDSVEEDEVDELGGLCTFGRTRQIYYAAEALSWLPSQTAAAADYAARAVTAYEDTSSPEWAFGDQAGSRSALAITRIRTGELEGATEAIQPMLELVPEQRINGIVHCAQRVHRALGESPHAEAGGELQEQIEAFTRTPLKSLPS